MCLLLLFGLPLAAFLFFLLVGITVLVLDKIVIVAVIVSLLYTGKKLVDKFL